MGSKPTFPEGDASHQGKLPDTVVVLCTSFSEETNEKYVDTLCGFYKSPKLKETSPSLFTKENVKDIFVLLTQAHSNKLLITDTDYSLLKFLRLKTVLNDLSYSIFDSTEYFVNDEEYRVIKWDEGIPFKLYENDRIYNTKFYEWKEFWECGEKLDYAPALPFAVPIPTVLAKMFEVENFKEDYISKWFHPNFVFSVIPLNDESSDWLNDLKGSTSKMSNDLLEEKVSSTERLLSGMHVCI